MGPQALVELEPAHAGHPHVEQQAAVELGPPDAQEGFRRGEGLDLEALGFEQPDEGVAQGFVVIHEVDDLFRQRGLRFHGESPGAA